MDDKVRAEARAAITKDESLNSISRPLGISGLTLLDWRATDRTHHQSRRADCRHCTNGQLPGEDYAHLLGPYVGGGCLSKLRKDINSLRISDKYPRLIDKPADAIPAFHPSRLVHRIQAIAPKSQAAAPPLTRPEDLLARRNRRTERGPLTVPSPQG
jgi:hypothetical protein